MLRQGSNILGCLGTSFFLLIFMAVGIGLSIWGWTVLQDARASESWPTTSGEILSANVRIDNDDDGTSYFGDVSFRYVVNDSVYTSDNVSFGQYGSSNRGRAEDIVAKYPVGSQVTVYYDANDPQTAALEPGVTWSSYLLLGMGALFTCIPLIVLPFMLLRRRQY
jgi:hypothetical protein